MSNVLYKTPNGEIVSFGYELPEAVARSSNLTILPIAVPFEDIRKFVVTGNDNLVEVEQEPEWATRRRKSYPSVGEQMDMLWHAMNEGALPKVEPFFSEIKSVKENYPKPTNS